MPRIHTMTATTYLNESMRKIYKCTPNSVHVPETLPEDLDADDITRPGRPDDAGIEMPGNARGVGNWLNRLGLLENSGIADFESDSSDKIHVYTTPGEIRVELAEDMAHNTVEVYNISGNLLHRMAAAKSYSFPVPSKSIYLLSVILGSDNKRINRKIVA